MVRSVADALREDDLRRDLARSPAERVAQALELGRRDLEYYRLAQDPPLSLEEAGRRLRRERQRGRVRSVCHESLDP